MANSEPVTCQIRYTLDLAQLGAFEIYARTWMSLIGLYGGTHHGYFIPRANPDEVGPSFPSLGYDGPTDVAVAMFTFPDEESYRRYRKERLQPTRRASWPPLSCESLDASHDTNAFSYSP